MKQTVFIALLVLLLLTGCASEPTNVTPTDEPTPAVEATDVAEPAEPIEDEPVDPEPVEQEPVESEPVESEPVVEEPAAEEPVTAQDTPAQEPEELPVTDPVPQDEPQAAPTDTPEPADSDAPAVAPVEEPVQETLPEEIPAEPGIWECEDGLYYVQEDGTLLTDGSVGYLTFDSQGRYTSGNATLDEGVDALLAAACTDPSADRETRLRAAYVYIRDNYRYLSMPHYEAGTTDWAETAATAMLSQGKGNCYCFTALFTYCARRLGYQAYNIAGHEYSPDNDHAWTMIDWPDGVTYLFDVQLEYAYLYQFADRAPIDMFKVSGSDGIYNGSVYYFP